jgi:ribonuclease P protein component
LEKSYTFPRTLRLGGRGTFSAIFDKGVRNAKGPLLVVLAGNDVGYTRLGISVPKRVGNAPTRNRIKRMVRESFRLMQHDWPGGFDVVVVVRPHEGMALAEYQRLLSGLIVKGVNAWGTRA